MKILVRRLLALLMVCGYTVTAQASPIYFDDFEGSLNGFTWDLSGGTTADTSSGYLKLTDNGYAYAKGVSLAAGTYLYEFKYKGKISSEYVQDQSFPDSFSAALIGSIWSGFDIQGTDPLPFPGTLQNDGWFLYRQIFTLSAATAMLAPVFALPDGNGTGIEALNSEIFIDNIAITEVGAPVPEPSTFVLFGIGGIAVLFFRKRS